MESEYLKSNKFRNHLPKNWYIKVSPGNKPTSVYDTVYDLYNVMKNKLKTSSFTTIHDGK